MLKKLLKGNKVDAATCLREFGVRPGQVSLECKVQRSSLVGVKTPCEKDMPHYFKKRVRET